jgi:DNA-binding response OmpR family regulator
MASVEKQLLGTETVRALRANGVNSIICGLSANHVEEQFYEAGADAFMMKPFPCKTDAFATELRSILRQGKQHGRIVPITPSH